MLHPHIADFAMQIILPNKIHGGNGLQTLEEEIGE
jgi:hypothetical protein